MKVTMSLVCALVGMASPLGASEPLSLKVTPSVAIAPATVRVLARIEPDTQNRMVEIVAESDDFYRSSQIQLEGDRARRTSLIELRSLPAGAYDVRVTLKGPGDATRAIIRQRVQIVGDSQQLGDLISGLRQPAESR